MAEKQNIPEIRFEGFTDPWEQRKLGDITSSYSGGTPQANNPDYYNGSIPFIRSAEINADKTELYLTEKGLAESSAALVDAGCILYALYGATSGEAGISRINGAINQAILAIYPYAGFDSGFLASWLRREKDAIVATYLQGGQGNLSGAIVKDFKVPVPGLPEQKAIGDCLSSLDNLITLHQRKCQYRSLYGYLSWEQRKLGEVAHRVIRKNESNQSDLPLTISAQHGLVDQRDYFNNQVASRDMSGYYLLENGEFAYNKSTSSDSPWGAIKRLTKYEKGCLSTLYICFGLDQGDPDFLVTYYETNRWHGAVQMIAAEGARNHGLLNIAPDDFLETALTLPCSTEEQKQIGCFFTQLNSLITLHQREPPHTMKEGKNVDQHQ